MFNQKLILLKGSTPTMALQSRWFHRLIGNIGSSADIRDQRWLGWIVPEVFPLTKFQWMVQCKVQGHESETAYSSTRSSLWCGTFNNKYIPRVTKCFYVNSSSAHYSRLEAFFVWPYCTRHKFSNKQTIVKLWFF